jgi:hypothetical protein
VCVQVFHVCVWGRVVACVCAASDCRLMRATAGERVPSNAVDLYNSATGAWSTAQLSVARYLFAAASVGNVAIFAGGVVNPVSFLGSVLLLIEGELWE